MSSRAKALYNLQHCQARLDGVRRWLRTTKTDEHHWSLAKRLDTLWTELADIATQIRE